MPLPQLTDEQRKAALEKAAAARHARAELREKIKKGDVSLESVLNSDDPIASRMKVSTLIESLPGYGKAKAAKIMEELGISATRRVQGLGVRQREQCFHAQAFCDFRTVRCRKGNVGRAGARPSP